MKLKNFKLKVSSITNWIGYSNKLHLFPRINFVTPIKIEFHYAIILFPQISFNFTIKKFKDSSYEEDRLIFGF